MIRYFFVLFFILLLVYIFLFSPIFRIQTLEISGNKEVNTESVKNNFDYKNIFLYTKHKIEKDLVQKFPKISNIEISKDLIKRIIKLEINERERLGIVCKTKIENEEEQMGKCFYIDKQGFIFEDAPQTSGSLILLIKDFSQREYSLGGQIFEEKTINSIYGIRENIFPETGIKILDFNIASFPVVELKAMTNEGWYILFELEGDIKKQLTSLKAALQEKIKNRESLEYVDLRIENRIYYK